MACVAVPGVKAAYKGEVVLYWGKRDLFVSFFAAIGLLLSFIFFISSLCTSNGDSALAFILISLATCPFLVYSIKRSHAANLRNTKTTFLVVVTKLALAVLILLCALVANAAFTSSNKRRSLIYQILVAAFIAYALKKAYDLAHRLIRENPLEDTQAELSP